MTEPVTTSEPHAPRRSGPPDATLHLLQRIDNQWDVALRDPAELRVAPTVANLVIALNGALRGWVSQTGKSRLPKNGMSLASKLVPMLLGALRAGEGDAALLMTLHPHETSEITAALAADSIEAQHLIALLSRLADTIDAPFGRIGALLSEHLPERAAKLVATGHYSEDMEAIGAFAARAALLHDRPNALKKVLQCWLSGGSATAIVEECRHELSSCDTLTLLVSERTQQLAERLAQIDLADRLVPIDDAPLHYGELWHAAEAVRTSGDVGAADAASRLADGICSGVASQLLFRTLTRVLGGSEDRVEAAWDALDDVSAPIEIWFADHGWITPREEFPAWGRLPRDATLRHFVHAISRDMAPALKAPCQSSFDALEAWVATGGLATQGFDQAGIIWHLAPRSVQDGLLTFRASVRSEVLAEMKRRIDRLKGDASELWNRSDSWARWTDELLDGATRSESAWRSVSWHRLTTQQLAIALSPLSRAFSVATEFDIISPVTGAKTESTAWQAGGLAWYTASTHSLGEAFNSTPDLDAKGLIHVWQRLKATTPHAAHEKAQLALEPALSALSFGLSAGDRMSGFRPGSDVWFAWGSPASGEGGWHGHRHRTESADRSVPANYLVSLSEVYAPLVERASDGLARSDLESGLLRALFWYRSGRWQPNHVRRFLDHFVALEHLFASGTRHKDEMVADGIASLEGSWRFRDWPFSAWIRPALDGARALSKEAEASDDVRFAADAVAMEGSSESRNAKHWRTHLSPWLSPSFVKAVSKQLPTQPPPQNWTSHLLTLQQQQEKEPTRRLEDVERARRAWFKIRHLAQRRHAIVHDAATYFPAIEFEADALTEVLENVIRHLVEDVLNRPGAADSMADVLNDLNAPWLR